MEKQINQALQFVKDQEVKNAMFTIAMANGVGELQPKEKSCYYKPLYEWLEKFPKYFRSFSPNSGRILVGHCLYQFEV